MHRSRDGRDRRPDDGPKHNIMANVTSSSSKNEKKKRAPNFTESEKDCFIQDILPKYSQYIECKKTDHMTNAEKSQKWTELGAEFNAKSTVHFRSVENLKNLWDNLKKSARVAASYEKRELFATGGGERNTSQNPTSQDLKVLAVLGSSGSGLVNDFDGDSMNNPSFLLPCSTATSQEPTESLCTIISTIDCSNITVASEPSGEESAQVLDANDWGSISPRLLYHPKPNALRVGSKEKVLSTTNAQPSDQEVGVRRKTLEEEGEWVRACKRRRPILKPDVDENRNKLVAAKLELTLSTKQELEENAKRQKILFEIEKKKKELEAEMMALQVLKMKKGLGL